MDVFLGCSEVKARAAVRRSMVLALAYSYQARLARCVIPLTLVSGPSCACAFWCSRCLTGNTLPRVRCFPHLVCHVEGLPVSALSSPGSSCLALKTRVRLA